MGLPGGDYMAAEFGKIHGAVLLAKQFDRAPILLLDAGYCLRLAASSASSFGEQANFKP